MNTLEAVPLPDLEWTDEFAWTPVRQQQQITLTGALVVEEAAVQAGRPITLTGDWASRAVVKALYALATVAGATYTLTLGDEQYTVMFRRNDGALSAEPVTALVDPDDSDFYQLTLRLMSV